MNNIFRSEPQPIEGLQPTTYRFFSFTQNAMKKLVVRFWFSCIIVIVLTLEFMWFGLVTSGNGTGKSSPATVLLFPVLFVIGTISHFYPRFRKR